ncbi:ionic transporter y4hA [Flexivirga endophytica]|uniref:Ionic transporter y4hA n=1 Tax=Flexivirga endophytica TaxID=1849103 RepID=A0A916WRH7_9MICO|nr:calcium:proton antiporter [Flexivirga endophytica]GGB25856.1 ionic transporter y4hA [Flexivirga endophytica]GHB54433.1 ionic transporter y4hA [Flexivirga endophytica]
MNPTRLRTALARWTVWAPILALLPLPFTFGKHIGPAWIVIVAALLGASVLAAVHHAEVVAHKVGEPFGSLVLAIAVTVIEVALIVTLMLSGGSDANTLARDTVFSAAMLTCNGIVGASLLAGAMRHHTVTFNAEGTGAALACVLTLATMCLVLPNFTSSVQGPEFSGSQLAFAAIASLALYGLFVVTQTVRHRDFFLPVDRADYRPLARGNGYTTATRDDLATQESEGEHAEPPTKRAALQSLVLLLVALIAVVGLAKVESKPIEDGVRGLGLPHSFVGVIIALLVLAPETLAAVNAARRDRVQISLNLGYGSAMASIGLTIPVIAIASIWLPTDLHLGLGHTQIVLLGLTAAVGILTVVPGRATRLQGGIHLILTAAFIFLAANP